MIGKMKKSGFVGNKLFVIAVFVFASLSLAYALSSNPDPGHVWNEVACDSNLCVDDITGRVGVGTVSPTEKLYVAGNIKSSGTICDGTGNCIAAVGSGTEWTTSGVNIYNSNTGNVGIGTASPGNKLTIMEGLTGYNAAAYNPAQFAIRTTDSSGYGGIRFVDALSQREAFFGVVETASGTGDFVFQGYIGDGSTYREYMRVNSQGNVGIGVANPAAKLEVGGNVIVNGGIYGGISSGNLLLVPGSAGSYVWVMSAGAGLYVDDQITSSSLTGTGTNRVCVNFAGVMCRNGVSGCVC